MGPGSCDLWGLWTRQALAQDIPSLLEESSAETCQERYLVAVAHGQKVKSTSHMAHGGHGAHRARGARGAHGTRWVPFMAPDRCRTAGGGRLAAAMSKMQSLGRVVKLWLVWIKPQNYKVKTLPQSLCFSTKTKPTHTVTVRDWDADCTFSHGVNISAMIMSIPTRMSETNEIHIGDWGWVQQGNCFVSVPSIVHVLAVVDNDFVGSNACACVSRVPSTPEGFSLPLWDMVSSKEFQISPRESKWV